VVQSAPESDGSGGIENGWKKYCMIGVDWEAQFWGEVGARSKGVVVGCQLSVGMRNTRDAVGKQTVERLRSPSSLRSDGSYHGRLGIEDRGRGRERDEDEDEDEDD
jgi:hypothetical protein